jgi:ABC-type multidrug transport system fused ATPase/permease subunit
VRSADTIFVIKEGKIAEQGSHEELIKDPDGVYAALISRQMESRKKLDGDEKTD